MIKILCLSICQVDNHKIYPVKNACSAEELFILSLQVDFMNLKDVSLTFLKYLGPATTYYVCKSHLELGQRYGNLIFLSK